MSLVDCAALAIVLADPLSSGVRTLTEDCTKGTTRPSFVVRDVFAKPLTIDANKRTVAGLHIDGGGNLIWRGGTIVAPSGSGLKTMGKGPAYYGVRITNSARNLTFDNVTFTNARKAIVFGEATGLVVRHSRCLGEVEDCMIASNGNDIKFTDNFVGPFKKNPAQCSHSNGMVAQLSKRDCTARGGSWRDGWHSDVVQLRNGVSNVYIAYNVITTSGQGLTQMDREVDAPIRNIRFSNNQIRAGRHGLTLGRCEGCLIDGNRLETSMGDLGWRAVIIPGQARACGNIVPSGGVGRDPC